MIDGGKVYVITDGENFHKKGDYWHPVAWKYAKKYTTEGAAKGILTKIQSYGYREIPNLRVATYICKVEEVTE